MGAECGTLKAEKEEAIMAHFVYLRILLLHKWCVVRAGLRVGGIPLWRLIIHDWSKLLPDEWFSYVAWYAKQRNRSAADAAFVRHWHRNPHHWEHWTDAHRKRSSHVPMPETYVREMVADWMAASMAYGSTGWDITQWLHSKYSKMVFHPDTTPVLERVLAEQSISLPY